MRGAEAVTVQPAPTCKSAAPRLVRPQIIEEPAAPMEEDVRPAATASSSGSSGGTRGRSRSRSSNSFTTNNSSGSSSAMAVDSSPNDSSSPQPPAPGCSFTPGQALFLRGPFGRSRSNSAASSVTSVASIISEYSNSDFEVPEQVTPIRSVPRAKSLQVLERYVARSRGEPSEDFLATVQRGEIRAYKRADLLRWLFALNNHFEFGANVFALTAEFVDKFLAVARVKDKYMHIIGVACFLIAAKIDEETDVHPTEAELVANSGDVFTTNDLVRMETIVLSKLNWELRPVTPLMILDELISVSKEKLVAVRGPEMLQALPALRLNAAVKLHMSLFHYQLRLLPAAWLALCVLAVELCELLPSPLVEEVLAEFTDFFGLEPATFKETIDIIHVNLAFQAGLSLPQGSGGSREDSGTVSGACSPPTA